MKKFRIGLVGCGIISEAYMKASKQFKNLEFVLCADLNASKAKEWGEKWQVKEVPIDDIYTSKEIDVILNLTIPAAHFEVCKKALDNGKHVYVEKPLSLHYAEAKELTEIAKAKKLRLGVAPDTFLGCGIQTSIKAINDNLIGAPVAGTAMMCGTGPESWHSNAGFYYQKGGGPVLDMGPYYITALVNLLGPVESVTAFARKLRETRFSTAEGNYGVTLPVEVNTTANAMLQFHSGAIINCIFSFDIKKDSNIPIEIQGTKGTLQIPDPNNFGGVVKLFRDKAKGYEGLPMLFPYAEQARSIGLADMGAAIEHNRNHRCNGELGAHVLEVLEAFDKSSELKQTVMMTSTCEKPEPLPLDVLPGFLDIV